MQLQGSALVKKGDWCKLELCQCHNFHQNVTKGVLDKFDLLSLSKVEKQLENVVTLMTNIKQVNNCLENKTFWITFCYGNPLVEEI